jgi:hypothetical protein
MKSRLLLISAVLMLSQLLHGQNLDDALRYSQLFYQGTARFTGMGGAFTALGGDLSAIPLNPASSALFRSFELTITPDFTYNKVNTRFNNGTASDKTSNIGLSQIGFVSGMNFGTGSGLNSLSFSYSYNKTNNLNMRGLIEGTGTNSSIAEYWASLANNHTTGTIGDYSAEGYMAYQNYLIDTLSGSPDQYGSIFSYYGEQGYTYGQSVRRVIDNSGYTAEHTIALGANIGDMIYLGASIGLTSIDYTGHYSHYETDVNNSIPYFKSLSYVDHFDVGGEGWNFKVGVILRPIESLRLGLSIATPTIYTINETYYKNLISDFDEGMNSNGDDHFEISQDPMYYTYKLTTPLRINTGAAFQIGSIAVLSVDYELVDYSTAKLSKGADGWDFTSEDRDIRSDLKTASNIRVGGEYRLGPVYFRGGYRYYGSAFRNGKLNDDTDYSGYSAGLGYRQKDFYIDFAYSSLVSSGKYMMYPDGDYLAPTTLNTDSKSFTATLGLKF